MGFERDTNIHNEEGIMSNVIEAIRKGTTALAYKLQASKQNHLFTVQYLPEYAELVNEGCVWTAEQATLVACAIAVPTTTAGISLYNNEPEGGKSYVILDIFGIQGGAPAALNSWGILHCIHADKPATLPTADLATATYVKGMKPRQGSYGGAAILDLACSVTDDLWRPAGNSINTVVISLTGTQIYVLIDGKVVIPPGGMYSLRGIASAVDVTVRLGYTWAEVQL